VPGLEGPGELGLFLADHLQDPVALLFEIRVGVLHHVDDDAGGDVHERLPPAKQSAVPHGTAQDPPQHVAAPLVGRRHSVGHKERDGARVVGDDLVAEPLRLESFGIVAEEITHRGVDGREQVRVVVGRHSLYDTGQSLQAHPRVDRLHRQRHPRAVGALLELHEDEIPDLEPARAVLRVVRHAVRSFAEFHPTVKVEFRAWAAWPGLGHAPEVGVVARLDVTPASYSFGRDTDLVVPDAVGFLVVGVDGHTDPIGWDLEVLGQQFPGPADRLALEVVAEAPVAQHLEEGVVTSRAPNLFEVVVLAGDAQTALVVSGPDIAPLLPPGQDVLELDHPGVGKQQSLVRRGHERGAGHHGMAAFGEELDISAANLRRAEAGNRQVRHRR
jgi:hypothetical protein